MRRIGTDAVTEAVKSYIWSRRTHELATMGLKVCSEGEWHIPAPEALAGVMPQVIVDYVEGQWTRDKPRRAMHGVHQIQLHVFRLLGDTEKKGVIVRQQAELVANLFAQDRFPLPGYTPVSGVTVEDCSVASVVIHDGFYLNDMVELDQATVTISVRTMSYDS